MLEVKLPSVGIEDVSRVARETLRRASRRASWFALASILALGFLGATELLRSTVSAEEEVNYAAFIGELGIRESSIAIYPPLNQPHNFGNNYQVNIEVKPANMSPQGDREVPLVRFVPYYPIK